MGPQILNSARRHGVADDDMLHAYRNPVGVFEPDDEDLTMLVGGDIAGRLLEVGVVQTDGVDFIVHAMAARPRFLGRQ